MTFRTMLASTALVVVASGTAFAQLPEDLQPGTDFATSTEYYQYLYDHFDGGTEHTYETVPHWEGLWSGAGNPIFREAFFVSGAGLFGAGGTVNPDILTPEYEAATTMRLELATQYGQQAYDRITTCEPPGYPRWLLEPYVREFVNTPTQSWWLNDLANDTRRIYIGQEHSNIEGTHSPEGDSIGFWVDDMLITNTVDIYPNDWFRGNPPTSNQLESVEVWTMGQQDDGTPLLTANVTFWDPISLLRPIQLTYTFRQNTGLMNAGYRLRHWECEIQNTVLSEDGQTTTLLLPGDPGYVDQRGGRHIPDLPTDLPGQELNPGEEALPDFPG